MKIIINGRKYDTETARAVGDACSTVGPLDHEFWVELLYRKTTGEFFLHGRGGPTSRYAIPEGNGWSGGEWIVPLTMDEAMTWAEKHLEVDAYEALFGVVEE